MYYVTCICYSGKDFRVTSVQDTSVNEWTESSVMISTRIQNLDTGITIRAIDDEEPGEIEGFVLQVTINSYSVGGMSRDVVVANNLNVVIEENDGKFLESLFFSYL